VSAVNFAEVRKRLEKQIAAENTSPKSGEVGTFPLSTFLDIIYKSGNLYYLNHMQGAKDLFHWLKPFNWEYDVYPEQLVGKLKVPHIFHTYQLNELAKILISDFKMGSMRERLAFSDHAAKAIYFATIHSDRRA
jgi:hypothetical protein